MNRLMAMTFLAGAIALQTAWSGTLQGRVLDVATGLPIEGALVRLEEKSKDRPPVRDSLRTGVDGRFSFTGLPAVTNPEFGYFLTAVKEGYFNGFKTFLNLQSEEVKTLDLSLDRMVYLNVAFTEGGLSGPAIRGASAVVDAGGWDYPSDRSLTDSSGRIRFGPYHRGAVEVTVSKPGFRTRTFRKILDGLAAEDSVSVEIQPDQPATNRSLHGTVTDTSGRLASIPFYFSCRIADRQAWLFARSGADGTYVLEGIPGECGTGTIHFTTIMPLEVALDGTDTRFDFKGPAIGVRVLRPGPAKPATARTPGRDVLGRRRVEAPHSLRPWLPWLNALD